MFVFFQSHAFIVCLHDLNVLCRFIMLIAGAPRAQDDFLRTSTRCVFCALRFYDFVCVSSLYIYNILCSIVGITLLVFCVCVCFMALD